MNITEFQKVDLRVGTVVRAESVAESEKLLRLEVNLGETDEAGAPILRQIVSGIKKVYSPETLVGKQVVVIANLEPRQILGLESRGMILAASNNNIPVLLSVEKEVPSGAKIT